MPPEPAAVLVPYPYAPGLVGPVGVPPDPPAVLQPHCALGLIWACAGIASAMSVAHSSHETVDRTAFILTRLAGGKLTDRGESHVGKQHRLINPWTTSTK